MPAKEISYQSIMRDLKNRKYSPVYLLMGDESYYIDKISDYIIDNVLKPEEKAFNENVVFGSDVTGAQIADLSMGYPMMSSYRVVVVKESQGMRGMEALEKYAGSPARSTILVLCHKNGTIDRRKRLVKQIEANGIVFESKKVRDYQLPGYVENYLKEQNVTIGQKAAEMIADNIGADLHRLVSELDKLLISLPKDRSEVTPGMVEQQIGVSKDFNPFELKSALVRRDVLKANQIIKYFDKNPKAGSVYMLVPQLFGYFQNLMVAYYAPKPHNEYSIAKYLGLKSSWAAKDYMEGMKSYSGKKTMSIIAKFREIDAKSKGIDNPGTSSADLLKELIYFILH